MAVKITKTEEKLNKLIEKRDEIRLNFSANTLAIAGRGFGKTVSGFQFIYSINEIDLQIARLRLKVQNIHDNREKRIQKKEQDKINRRLDREGQKFATSVQEWLSQ